MGEIFWQRLKELPWWAISLSLGINIFSLGIVVVSIIYLGQDITLIVTGFLFFHIFVSQPLKDWMIGRMGRTNRYSSQITFLNFENRVSRIARVQDILEFLSWLIRAWKLGRVRLLIFDEEDFVYFFTQKKRVRKMRLKDEISESFKNELAAVPGGRLVGQLSGPLRAYMQSRKVKFIAPLLFRDRLIGLLGFTEVIEKSRLPLLDHAAHRMGLALENEQLERTVPRSEFLKKEFRVAERIEQHLSGASRYDAGAYNVQKLETAWEKKHFAAIFGCAPGPTGAGKDRLWFIMLLRLSVASTRMNALQLFATQGYFYSLSRHAVSVENLGQTMGAALRQNENQAIQLEGFLLSLDGGEKEVRILSFGSHLAYRDQSGWTWVRESAPLKNESFDMYSVIALPEQKELILSVREYPLILINGGTVGTS